MRRRVSEQAAPEQLLVFDGRQYCSGAEWEAAFHEWTRARNAWSAKHAGVELARRVVGECPWDPSMI